MLSVDDGEVVGYFTIALKPLIIHGEGLSNTLKRKLLRVSELDEESKTYTMSAYLIAQLSKNFHNNLNDRIKGDELLQIAWNKIEELQYMVGGMVSFVEASDNEKLLSFYKNNGFMVFDTRQSSSKLNAEHELIQLLRLI